MNLIHALSSGVIGCENGRAEIYRRGTLTRATYYTAYDGTGSVASGANIDLDSSGGSPTPVYVAEPVDVRVYTSAGVLKRSFTDGPSSGATEAISQSFTGTDYETAASAANKPTTLKAILDLWLTNVGAIDWKTVVDGATTTIPDALSALTGIFFNVKAPAYGAVGDGSQDDTSAINAAIAAAEAAGGGIVFFPAGVYRLTAKLQVTENVTLWGSGPNASELKMDDASADVLEVLGDNTSPITDYQRYQEIRGLRVTANVACTGNAIVFTGTFLRVENCVIGDGSNLQGDLVTTTGAPNHGRLVFRDCRFLVGASTVSALNATDADVRHIFDNCEFVPPATYNGNLITACNIEARGCFFDNSTATSGTMNDIRVESGANSIITGSRFTASGGATVVAIDTNSLGSSDDLLLEDNNVFDVSGTGAITPYDLASGTDNEKVILGTRRKLGALVETTGSTLTVSSNSFKTIVVKQTTSSAMTITAEADPPIYDELNLVVWNDGTGGNLTVTLDSATFNADTPPVVADNEVMVFKFVSLIAQDGTVQWWQANTPVSVVE